MIRKRLADDAGGGVAHGRQRDIDNAVTAEEGVDHGVLGVAAPHDVIVAAVAVAFGAAHDVGELEPRPERADGGGEYLGRPRRSGDPVMGSEPRDVGSGVQGLVGDEAGGGVAGLAYAEGRTPPRQGPSV